MIEAAHYSDMWNILDMLQGSKSHLCRRNPVYSATLLVPRMAKQKTRTKFTSKQEVIGKHCKFFLFCSTCKVHAVACYL